MKKRAGFSLAVLATAILLLCQNAPRAFPQDYPPDQPQYQGEQDPPTRAGRLSYTEGSVSFQPGGEGDWLDAVRNRPLTVGDNLWVDRDSRAEIQIGSTYIRLGPETSVTFLDLGNNITQLRLSVGSIYVRVRRFDGDDAFEVDTPNLAFNVNRAGSYRIDTNENGDQTIADVYRGEAEITGSGNSYRLDEGQEGSFSGTDQLSYDVGDIEAPDDFGRWAQSRDERAERARSRQYVSEDMTGYEDLDDYGSWRNDPEYGNVWQPAGIPGDWAPYRYGHWAYVSPWGWTWVEDEPWGFAPFHYGRWAFVRSSWCWVPGPVAVAPVYAPALVAFVGGGGFSVGIGIGSEPVGWFPLGPREVFVPWYQTSPRYVQNVNVTNTNVSVVQVTNVYNNYTTNHVNNVTYVNQHVNNSVTVVNHDTFVNARPVNRNIERVDARQLANARVTPAVVRNVQPSRQSFQGVAHPVQYRPPQQTISRPVVATRQPVVYNRAANRPNAGPGAAARPTPPPVRTVHAAPPAQIKPLQRGARGGPNPPAPGGRQGQNGQRNRPGQANNPGNRPGQPNGAENRPGQPNGQARPGQPNNGPDNRPGQPNGPDNRGAAPRPGQPNNGPDNRPGQPNGPDNRGAAPRPGQPNNGPDNRPDNRPGGHDNRNVPRPGGPGNANPGARPNDNAPRPGAPDNRNVPPETRNAPRDNGRPGAPDDRNAPGDNGRPGGPDNRNAPAPNNHNVPRPPSANSPDQQPRQYPGTRPENNRPQEQPQARPDNNRPQQPPQMRPQQPSRPPETPQTRPEEPARPPETRQQPPPQSRAEMQRNPPPQARPAEPPPQRESRPMPPPERESRPAPPPQHESHPAPPPQRESHPAPPPQREKHPEPPPKDKDKEPPKGR